MKAIFLGGLLAMAGLATANTFVVPQQFTNTNGNGGLNTLTRQFDRAYLLVINESELTGRLNVGDRIEGMRWRSWVGAGQPATWPPADISWTDFDVYMGQSSRTAQTISTTYADNYVAGTRTQVRSGPLTIPANSYTTATSGVSPWGPELTLNTPYVYTGGPLVVEFRHRGNNGNTALFLDVVTDNLNNPVRGIASSGTAGTNYTATTGTATSATITQFRTATGGGPQNFDPTSFNIVRGALEAGALADILTSNDAYLRVRNGAIALPAESPITIDFIGTSPLPTASALSVEIENRVSIGGLAQRIQMRRYEGTPGFVQIDELIPAPTTDTVRFANATAPHSDFIRDGDREVTARLLVRAAGPLFTNTWRTFVDQVRFKVTP